MANSKMKSKATLGAMADSEMKSKATLGIMADSKMIYKFYVTRKQVLAWCC